MPTETRYDAIVVGARCAGSPTAMLLARKSHKVLVVDKDEFPSDTISTLMIHPPGIAALRRWGLLDRLASTGCPPIPKYKFDFGHFGLVGRPRPIDGVDVAFAPRRTVLDKLLLDAAAEAGAEIRTGFSVDEIVFDDDRVSGIRGRARGGAAVVESARIVIGADGRHSAVAKAARPEQYKERPVLQSGYYTFWSNLPADGFETYIRPSRGWAAIPTHGGLTLVVAGWPYAEFAANKKDVESHYLDAFQAAPEFAERIRAAKREEPYRGGAVPNAFRKPYGPGWALVGDAGYIKDPVTAWGISDALHGAELCSTAVSEWLTGARPFEDAMDDYQQTRDEHSLPMFDLTCQFAALAPPPLEMQHLLGACAATQEGQDQFVSMMAGTLRVEEFFTPGGAVSSHY